MPQTEIEKPDILYVFGGERAQGAEIVIERLMAYNSDNVNAHLILSPGKFANDLLSNPKPYKVSTFDGLKKLNRNDSGSIIFYLKALKNFFTVSYFVYKYIRENKIKLIHANTIVPAAYLIPLVVYSRLFLRSIKWCWSDHDMKYFSQLDTSQSNLCAKLYHKTLVVSCAVKNKYHNQNKIKVLYNGLNINYFKPDEYNRNQFRQKNNLHGDVIVIAIAASIVADKGQLGLIEVFNTLSSNFTNIRLVLAGGFAANKPDYCTKVKQAIGNRPNIILLNFVNDMVSFYNGCDIIVNNSNNYRSESFGTTIYEAMACEKLVVAANTGGSPEIISHNVDGYLFEAENKNALQQTLQHIILNYNSLQSFRQAAREKVKQQFDIRIMAKNYNLIIRQMLAA
jgi:glycosyltransferase involved in cell wall biosynthesis